MWLIMRGAMGDNVEELHRFYHVPASNTAVGHLVVRPCRPARPGREQTHADRTRRGRRLRHQAPRRPAPTSTASRSRPWSAAGSSRPRRSRSKYGVGHATTDLDEVLARDDVDAVILCTPTQLHARQAIAAMRAGKHVQVEIPLADSWADAQQVGRVQRETGLVCMVGHTRRFNPSHQWIHHRIAAGELSIQQMDVQTYFFRRTNTERPRPAPQLDRPPALAPRRAHRRPVPVPDRRGRSRSPTPCRGRSTPSSASRWTCPSS